MNKKKEDLFWLLNATAEAIEEEPDGAYWQILRDTVLIYNDDHKTNFDEHDAVNEWAGWEYNGWTPKKQREITNDK